jgi:hypothetical protein
VIQPSTQRAFGVGYAASARELKRGAIESLHAVDPSTGRAWCGKPLSLVWSAEDAGGAEPDCSECQRAIEQGRVS